MRIRPLLALALLGLAASPLAAQDPEPAATVAVLDLEAASLSLDDAAAVGKGVAGMLATELSGRPGIRVVERARLQSLLTEQKLALSGRVDDRTAVEVGKLLGANYLLKGVVMLWGEQARLDLHILNVETGELFQVDKVSGEPGDLLGMVNEIADRFARNLDLEVPQRAAAEEVPIRAVILFSQGLDLEDRGELDRAAAKYREALAAFPGYREATTALERVERGGER